MRHPVLSLLHFTLPCSVPRPRVPPRRHHIKRPPVEPLHDRELVEPGLVFGRAGSDALEGDRERMSGVGAGGGGGHGGGVGPGLNEGVGQIALRLVRRGLNKLLKDYVHYRSRILSLLACSSGLRKYSINLRWPVLISTVTVMPGLRYTSLSFSTRIVERFMLTRAAYTSPTLSTGTASFDSVRIFPSMVP